MRQGSNSKRPRGKGGNRGGNGARNSLNRTYDSNGPAGRVRGNPHQVLEKYLSLARDAQAEDPILAENLLQHADHYFRVIAEASGNRPRHENRREDGYDQSDDNSGQRASEPTGDGYMDNVVSGEDSRDDRVADGADSGASAEMSAADDQGQAPARRQRRPRRPKPEASGGDEVTSDAAA